MRHRTFILSTLLALICWLPASVAAQDASLEQALRDLGLNDAQVTLEADRALVVYQQPVAGMGPFEAELERVARALALFGDRLAPDAEVSLQQRFDDGQIMQVVGTPALGNAFLDGEIDAAAFEMALRFEPLTRGPLIIEGTCLPAAGDTCETNPACACYPNESCQPADPAANPKGCVTTTVPANAHLEATEYVCDDGFVWNLNLTGCVPAPADDGIQVEEAVQEPLTGLLDWTWILWVCGGIALIGFLSLLVVAGLMVRRRKRRAKPTPAAAWQPTPIAAPSAPAPPDRYAEVERRFQALQAGYQAGSVDHATYEAEVKKLVVQDEDGRYWALTNAGWHWYDGQRWVRADPPGRDARET